MDHLQAAQGLCGDANLRVHIPAGGGAAAWCIIAVSANLLAACSYTGILQWNVQYSCFQDALPTEIRGRGLCRDRTSLCSQA